VILSAAYALWLYRRVIFGKLEKENLKAIADMNGREIAIMAPLVALTILFGVWPQPILDVTTVSVEHLINSYQAALSAASDVASAAAH
jgi:NADH-quinone oxidoreductase subunit M